METFIITHPTSSHWSRQLLEILQQWPSGCYCVSFCRSTQRRFISSIFPFPFHVFSLSHHSFPLSHWLWQAARQVRYWVMLWSVEPRVVLQATFDYWSAVLMLFHSEYNITLFLFCLSERKCFIEYFILVEDFAQWFSVRVYVPLPSASQWEMIMITQHSCSSWMAPNLSPPFFFLLPEASALRNCFYFLFWNLH